MTMDYAQIEKNFVDALGRLIEAYIEKALAAEKARTQSAIRWVYFIQGVDGGPIKIGVANEPNKRLSELQRTSPIKLTILATEPGGAARERELHDRFSEWRLHGEWFEDCSDLVAYIESLKGVVV